MDASTDPPVPATDEHMAHAASALPRQGPIHDHPPYAEMIISAIKALNEKKGSSKKAIAKFIDAGYTDLPPAHSALLAHHLKRLKKKGHVLMVKHSYTLPKSVPATLKRGRGRPPKPKPISAAFNTASGDVSVQKRGRGRPPNPKDFPFVSGAIAQVLMLKSSRGRPRKPKILTGYVSAGASNLLPKKSPGRPPKPKSVILPGSNGGVLPLSPKPRGRPRNVSSPGTVMKVPHVVSEGKPPGRGRPRKSSSPATVKVKVPGIVSEGKYRGRGRPPKKVKIVNGLVGDVNVVSPGKRRGRPPKVLGEVKIAETGGVTMEGN